MFMKKIYKKGIFQEFYRVLKGTMFKDLCDLAFAKSETI